VLGKTGLGVIDHTDPTFELLANIGFALVMFVVGTHVPVRDGAMRSAAPAALVRAVLVGAVAAVLAWDSRRSSTPGTPPSMEFLMASSSAALALPIIDGLRLSGPPVLSVTAQIAVADTRAHRDGRRAECRRGARAGSIHQGQHTMHAVSATAIWAVTESTGGPDNRSPSMMGRARAADDDAIRTP